MLKKLSLVATAVLLSVVIAGCGTETVKDKKMSLPFGANEEKGTRTGVYSGEVNKEGLPNGKGRFDTQNPKGNKWYYVGEFKNGRCDGQGFTEFPDFKQKTEGTFKNFELNGKGKITLSNGSFYEGTFVSHELEGEGKYLSKTYENNKTALYEGNFKKGKIVEGKLTVENKLIHTGSFINFNPVLKSVGMDTPQTYADWEYKVNYAKNIGSVIGSKQSSGTFILVNIDATNKNFASRELGSRMFFLVDDQDRSYLMDSSSALSYHHAMGTKNWHLSSANPSITLKDIPLIFEVPKDAKGLLLCCNAKSSKDVAPIILNLSK